MSTFTADSEVVDEGRSEVSYYNSEQNEEVTTRLNKWTTIYNGIKEE